jgi:hypothetical protein
MSTEITIGVIGIFKLLTPTEVARLTETASKRSSKSLSAIESVERALNSEGVLDPSKVCLSAKIIPINKNKEEVVTEIMGEISHELDEKLGSNEGVFQQQAPSKVLAFDGSGAMNLDYDVDVELTADERRLETVGIVASHKVAEIEKLKKEEELKSSQSASVFLLNERAKVLKSQRRLHNQKAITMYKNSAKVEATKVIDAPDEKVSVGSLGILLNKNQF